MAELASQLQDFLAVLVSTRGDLASISAPPFLLAPFSVVEVAGAWLQRPSLIASVAREPAPERRALMILKWILASHKSQFYLGGSPSGGLKKPLNAFLGEIFLARFVEDDVNFHLVSEQVSHHPPITAVHMWDESTGISATGYVRVQMKFSSGVIVRQIGHVVVHVPQFDERYIIPFPSATVKGFLSGQLYPELFGTYKIISSSGYVSEITYSGKGFFGQGQRNSFNARVYHQADAMNPLYTASGQWIGKFSMREARTGDLIEEYDCLGSGNVANPVVTATEEQDAWESRRVWQEAISALKQNNFQKVLAEKHKVEMSQRALRAQEAQSGQVWKPLLFRPMQGEYKVFDSLTSEIQWELHADETKGVWEPDVEKIKNLKKPFRGDTTPLG
ncbi:unnamed protein product [Clonostachys rosea]|uniref:Oxysterol-binding protein n=1 Tax=Bionectria ochroleuca TaxID=29856 RepID=A0ABY6UDI2_BIOOC|nr:unnamed protein product [Clonostachys rosea]